MVVPATPPAPTWMDGHVDAKEKKKENHVGNNILIVSVNLSFSLRKNKRGMCCNVRCSSCDLIFVYLIFKQTFGKTFANWRNERTQSP